MKQETKLTRYLVPAILIALGIGFVIYGIFDEEALAVLHKATAICMECICIG